MSDVTLILQRMEQGEPGAAEELMPLVYEELRKLAAAKMAREPAGQTLQATALVHAVGPGLAQLGVGGFLADPQLAVIPLGRDFTVARNDNWSGSAALAAVFTQAGAFALAPDSRDAALVVTLPPGG